MQHSLFVFFYLIIVGLFLCLMKALLRFSGFLLLLKMRPVCAKMLVWLMLCSFLSASTQALIDMKERLKDRVVHVETLIHRGRWLWQNDNKDHGGSRYLFIDLIAERNTYYEPRVQFQARACAGGKYLCFEPLSLPHYYLTAGFPTGAPSKYTVKLQYSTYVDNDVSKICHSTSFSQRLCTHRLWAEGFLGSFG